MASGKFTFELLCIDPKELISQQGFIRGLSYNEALFNNNLPLTTKDAAGKEYLKSEGLVLQVLPLDTSKILTDLVEAAFVLRVESQFFEPLEPFRQRLIRHLKDNLKFNHVRVLQDDISAEIANQLYPKINAVENLLRRYLIKFFFQRVGLNWWEITATSKMQEKIKTRLRNRSNQFSHYVTSDIEFADFDDLGLLIYKQSTGFNDPERVVLMLEDVNSIEDLNRLKEDLQGNYTKYFKRFFRDKDFEASWKEMSKIRNKVAHQATFHQAELLKGKRLSENLTAIISEAEQHIDEIVLSLQEKQAIHNAAVEVVREEEEEVAEANANGDHRQGTRAPSDTPDKAGTEKKTDYDARYKIEPPKVLGTIKIDHKMKTYKRTATPGYIIITEEELVDELREAQQLGYTDYVGLKWFVTNYLANKGYQIGTTYSLINILIEQASIILYDVESNEGHYVKAVKLPAGY